jgi:Ca-activated chloride channel family protein
MNLLAQFHFLRPAWLLLLAGLPFAVLLWRRARVDAGAWRGAVDAHLLEHLIEHGDARRPGRGFALALLIAGLIVLSLAGPSWEREPTPLYRNQAARVLALELAPTMLAEDIKPSRLERARFKLDDILERSRDRQTALIAYAGAAFVAAPLTDDVATVRNLVDSLDPSTMPVAGNATAAAIERATALVAQAGVGQGELILLVDSVGPEALAAARRARAQGLTVSVIGVGSRIGAPVALPQGGFLKDGSGAIVVPRLDAASLREVAAAGGGRFALLSADASDLDAVLTDRPLAGPAGIEPESDSAMRWRDRGPWLLLLVLPLALAGFRRGWLMAVALLLLAPLPRAGAAGLSGLWQRPDQQAAAALARGDAREAARVATTPDWRASAEYRAGDYQAAAKAYAQSSGAEAAYNRGNALARLGRYQDALAAYGQALAADPGMDDATANRKAIKEWLARHPQKKPQQGSKPSSGKSSDQDSPPDAPQPGAQQGSDAPGKNASPGPGNDQPGAARPSPDQSSQPAEADGNGQASQDARDGKDGSWQTGSDTHDQPSPAMEAGASAAQKQALSDAIDRAMANSAKDPHDDASKQVRAGAGHEDPAATEKRQALEQWLERVPDDPGGLLRRKFLLEYQRRQQAGAGGP